MDALFIFGSCILPHYLRQIIGITRATIAVRVGSNSIHRVVLLLPNCVPSAIESLSKMHAVLMQL